MLSLSEQRKILNSCGSHQGSRRANRKIKCPIILVSGFDPPKMTSDLRGNTRCVVGIGWCCQNL